MTDLTVSVTFSYEDVARLRSLAHDRGCTLTQALTGAIYTEYYLRELFKAKFRVFICDPGLITETEVILRT